MTIIEMMLCSSIQRFYEFGVTNYASTDAALVELFGFLVILAYSLPFVNDLWVYIEGHGNKQLIEGN
jgi:hypothetical protein